MAWESINEWEEACGEKIKKIENYYKDICNKDHGMFRIFIRYAEKYHDYDDDCRTVAHFIYFIGRTITRYNSFIDSKSSECINNQIQQIKEYNEELLKDDKQYTLKFHDFIDRSWENYKNLEDKSEKNFRNLYENLEKFELQSNSISEPNDEIFENIKKLEKSYSNNFIQLKNKLKSDIQNLKKFGEECGVIRVAKLQRLILSEKGDFGLLYYLEKSFELIEIFFEHQLYFIKNQQKFLNLGLGKYYLNETMNFLTSNEGMGAEEIEKEVDSFFDKDSNYIDYKNLKGNFRCDEYYKQLNCFIEFIEKNLTEEIPKYIEASLNFYKNQVNENSGDNDNEKKLNSEMKYVFQYILKKINSFCSNKKKEFKEQQKAKSETIIISGKAMNQIMDLLKCIAINKFLSTDKLKSFSNKVEHILERIRMILFNIVFWGIVCTILGIAISISKMVACITAVILGLSALPIVGPPATAVGAGIVATGTFFYELFKTIKHRKIKNKFKKFLKEQENDKDQDGNLPQAPTVTPINEPETPY